MKNSKAEEHKKERLATRGVVREIRFAPAKSAGRALDVLHHFGSKQKPLRATDIAHAFDLSPSSADQLLKTLVELAYLTFNGRTKLYFPSMRLLGFAEMLSSHYGGERLLRMMSKVQSETNEQVVIVTLCDTTIQLVDSLNFGDSSGMRFELDSTAGAMLLGQYADKEIREIVERAVLYHRCSKDRAPALIGTSIAARVAGYASGDSLAVPGCWTLAVPLPLKSAETPVVLSLFGETKRIRPNQQKMVDTMRSCIQQTFE
jgi:DNA-binding IclR family transcriptional regulator